MNLSEGERSTEATRPEERVCGLAGRVGRPEGRGDAGREMAASSRRSPRGRWRQAPVRTPPPSPHGLGFRALFSVGPHH